MKKVSILLFIFAFGFFSFNINTVNAYDPACTPGPYNTRTGKLCTAEDIGTVCPTGHIYSTVTGKKCDAWTTTTYPNQSSNTSPFSKTLTIATSGTLPRVQAGKSYSVDISAIGGMEGYSWAVPSGNMPPGLLLVQPQVINCIQAPCLSRSPVVISGTPTRTGKYSFTVSVTSGALKTQKSFFIEVTNY